MWIDGPEMISQLQSLFGASPLHVGTPFLNESEWRNPSLREGQ